MHDANAMAPKELIQAQRLANITDTAVRIPFIGIEVGLDFLIGLIPGIGDAIMTLVALRIVHLGRRLGMPSGLQRTMLRNCVVDFGLGFLPIVGDLIDIFFKANKRNVRIMTRWWLEQNQHNIAENTQQTLSEWQANQAD